MNEEIIKVLDKLGEKFGIAIDWTNQNIMPYMEELIRRCSIYYISSCIVWLTIETIWATVCLIIFKRLLKETKATKERRDFKVWEWSCLDEGFGRSIFLILSALILLIIIPITTQCLLKGICMPELIFLNALGGNL